MNKLHISEAGRGVYFILGGIIMRKGYLPHTERKLIIMDDL